MEGHTSQISPFFSKFLKNNGCYVKYCYYLRKYGQQGVPYFTVMSIPWDKTYEDINLEYISPSNLEFL